MVNNDVASFVHCAKRERHGDTWVAANERAWRLVCDEALIQARIRSIKSQVYWHMLKENTRHLRSCSVPFVASSRFSNALRNYSAELFKKLPSEMRKAKTATIFSAQTCNSLYIGASLF